MVGTVNVLEINGNANEIFVNIYLIKCDSRKSVIKSLILNGSDNKVSFSQSSFEQCKQTNQNNNNMVSVKNNQNYFHDDDNDNNAILCPKSSPQKKRKELNNLENQSGVKPFCLSSISLISSDQWSTRRNSFTRQISTNRTYNNLTSCPDLYNLSLNYINEESFNNNELENDNNFQSEEEDGEEAEEEIQRKDLKSKDK